MTAWVSGDAGHNWVQRTMPQSIDAPGEAGSESGNVCCDPTFAADELGNVWFGGLALAHGHGVPSRIVVNRRRVVDRHHRLVLGAGGTNGKADARRIVGWQLAGHMRTDLVLDALRMALGTRDRGADVELVHHSDRGSQYTSIDFTQELTDHDVLASVGSVGDAYDNAMAESFVDSFKTELVADRVWQSRSQLELATVEYIAWFNNDRLHESLGDIPPVEFEALYAAKEPPLIPLPMKIGTN